MVEKEIKWIEVKDGEGFFNKPPHTLGVCKKCGESAWIINAWVEGADPCTKCGGVMELKNVFGGKCDTAIKILTNGCFGSPFIINKNKI